MTTVTVHSGEGFQAVIRAGNFIVHADDSSAVGGTDIGPTPPELFLGALGACAVITMKMYAQRKGWDFQGADVEVGEQRFAAQDYPAYEGDSDFVYEFRQRMHIRGNLTPEQKNRLIEIAGKCPVHKMLTYPKFAIEEWVDEEVRREANPATGD